MSGGRPQPLTMMKATYHTLNGPVPLDVLQKHDDGTVDLGRGSAVLVQRCEIRKEPQLGAATLDAKPAPEKEVAK